MLNQSTTADHSVDYANYLLEIQQGKMNIMQGLKDRRESGNAVSKLIKGDVKKETIDFYDLGKSSGAAQNEPTQKMQQEQVVETA